jgi:histidinol dehydrogenase
MNIIKGYQAASEALSRDIPVLAYPVSEKLASRLQADFGTADPDAAVAAIISRVREGGDAALRELTQQIDGVALEGLEVPAAEIKAAVSNCEPELLAALKLAAAQIKDFYREQRRLIWDAALNTATGHITRPLNRVGLYVPGGTAAYPSTVLMTAIPAVVAGVREIVLVTPPRDGGKVPAATLAAADIAGVDRVFSIGGAQAIAALAYGTETVPRVDKICGPGNIFVMLAKKQVYGMVDIDGLMGPSEVMVIADETANPAYAAADLLAQAEHDTLAQVVLVTTSEAVATAVMGEVTAQMADLPRRDIAAECLEKRGIVAVVDSAEEAVRLANLYAAEHLIILTKNPELIAMRVENAGCIFLGDYASVAMGDYISGPSHVLPTGGTARFASPLNIGDFMKLTDLVRVDYDTLRKLGPAAALLARAEGLEGHARALDRRLQEK